VLDTLVFWLLAVAVGLIGLPFAGLMFGRLPGGGLAFARPAGMLVVAYPLWLLVSVHAVTYGRTAAAVAAAVAAIAAVTLGPRILRPYRERPPSLPVRLWLVGEALFTVCFVGWAVLRSFAPEVLQTEKPMDMAIVNAIDKSGSFPPPDPWFSGSRLNYYYFGHYFNAFLIRLTGIDPAVGYNLGVALFFALTAAAVYGVASALYLALRREVAAPNGALAAGLAAAGFAVAGNLAGAFRYLHHPGRIGDYSWFLPSRVIPGTANEFPFFSFLLGDLHAHVLAAPFALTALAFAMQICLSGPRFGRGTFTASRAWAAAELVLGALVLGVLYAINSLDYPTAAAIAALSVVLWALARPSAWLPTLVWGVLWIGGSFLLVAPFWANFTPTTNGIGVVHDRTNFSTFLKDEFLIYGLSLWVIVALLARRRRVPVRYLVWGTVAATIGLVLLSPARLANVVIALGLPAIALFFSLAGERPQAERFLWLIVAVGIGLVGIGEFVYIRDSFDGTSSFRFNTVFKAGYQAWMLLAVAAGCVLVWNYDRLRGWPGRIWKTGLACLIVLALVYPVVASYARSRGFTGTPTLDGMAWLQRAAPGDASAINWLRLHASPSATVLETVGPDFDPSGAARVSTFTGLPTVMGWVGHEIQWGHDPGRRPANVTTIYETSDLDRARALLRRYDVRYVFVGSLERRRYPPHALAKFERLGKKVFSSRGTSVYRLPSESA
jgi:YYY domain-containing protein